MLDVPSAVSNVMQMQYLGQLPNKSVSHDTSPSNKESKTSYLIRTHSIHQIFLVCKDQNRNSGELFFFKKGLQLHTSFVYPASVCAVNHVDLQTTIVHILLFTCSKTTLPGMYRAGINLTKASV
jgi:hypothetical protein